MHSFILLLVGILGSVRPEPVEFEEVDSSLKQKRSTANLEYVMKVLEEQGRLHEVDADLLQRINVAIKGSKNQKQQQGHQLSRTSKEIIGNPTRPVTTQRGNVLALARARQQRLFGSRLQKQNERNSLEVQEDSRTKQCNALEVENRRLKQQLIEVQQDKQRQAENKLKLLSSIQSTELPTDPLEKLIQSSNENDFEEIRPVNAPYLSSYLVSPTPTLSTIFETTSFITTSTVTVSKEIGIYYHGKRIPTHILETETQVQTVTSTMSSVLEITPSPIWETVTVTPTVTLPPPTSKPTTPPPVPIIKPSPRDRFTGYADDQFRSSGGVRAEVLEIPRALDNFETLQNYLAHLRKLKAEEHEVQQIVAQPLIAPEEPIEVTTQVPTTSLSTIYMSGSVPGQYSSSVITVHLGGDSPQRIKRDIAPSSPLPVLSTNKPDLLGVFNPISIDSSFMEDQRCGNTHTVTVTVTQSCTHP